MAGIPLNQTGKTVQINRANSVARLVCTPENRRQPPKLALVACARKPLIFADTGLRETPWTTKKPAEKEWCG
jgi:hypothetical protein